MSGRSSSVGLQRYAPCDLVHVDRHATCIHEPRALAGGRPCDETKPGTCVASGMPVMVAPTKGAGDLGFHAASGVANSCAPWAELLSGSPDVPRTREAETPTAGAKSQARR